MHHQAVGGDQQDLEEHEQVEEVAGQEGAVEKIHLGKLMGKDFIITSF